MSLKTLYVSREPLNGQLTLGMLRQYITPGVPLWISIEPRPWLLERDGQSLTGRLPGLEPLTRSLPEGLDDLPLLAASLYEQSQWRHFYDAHPLSKLPGQCITWSLAPREGAESIEGLLCHNQHVLTWQDRRRFGLAPQSPLPTLLETEHYHQNGKRLAWRLIPTQAEASQ